MGAAPAPVLYSIAKETDWERYDRASLPLSLIRYDIGYILKFFIGPKNKGKALSQMAERSMLALPIFPVRLQTSIVGRIELNFRVRNGNGWTLDLINTNLLSFEKESKQRKLSVSVYR